MSYLRNIVETEKAPEAVGVYSQGIEHLGVFYFSGQIGIDLKGQLQENFKEQLDQVLKNIDGLLDSQGLDRSHILKTTIFMTDLSKFSHVNDAYKEFFKEPYPARSCVQVPALPKGAEIEIEVMASK